MWIVPEIGPQDTRQDSTLERFFDEQPKAVALVRESIQNSLDAVSNPNLPVRVRFSFSKLHSDVVAKYFRSEDYSFSEHLKQCGITLKTGMIPVLTIEDFNTDGLTGETDNTKVSDSNGRPISGNFLGFWWTEGQSAKRIGSGGSHGVGKVKLSTSSDYNSFLALTKRSDDNRQLLIGYSQLKVHILNNKRFRSYARFGILSNSEDVQGKLNPYDAEIPDQQCFINKFATDFILERKSETGLSVAIPAINKDINAKEILEALLTEFYIPVLKNKLVAEVCEGGKTIIVNAESLSDLTAQHLDPKHEEILRAARHMLTLSKSGINVTKIGTDLGNDPTRHIEMSDFSSSTLAQMQQDFACGKMVGARIPITIYPQPDENGTELAPVETYFEVFLQNNENSLLEKHDAFIRGNLYIRKETSGLGKPYSIAFVYADAQPLSEFLKYAEDPGHEKWKASTLKQKGHYRKDRETLIFIKSSVKDLYNALDGVDEDEKVREVSPEIFSIFEPTSGPSKGEKNPIPPPDIKTRSKTPFAIVRKNGGFEIRSSKFLSEMVAEGVLCIPFTCGLQIGYKKPFSNSIKSYNTLDFQLQDQKRFIMEKTNTEVQKSEGNSIQFAVTNDNFSLEVKGFDPNRDLEIYCKVINDGGA